jgi:1,4-dihydroxy-2-naphthoyl-CoA hydrolase
MFYAHLFRHAHDAYETFMGAVGTPLDRIIRDGGPTLPLAHADADYRGPLRHGERLAIDLCVARVGRTSFTLAYRFLDAQGRVRAKAHTVHVHLGPGGATPAPLPETLTLALEDWRCRDEGR